MSENTQINVSTTTEIVNVDVTETLQPVSLECFFANGSAQDTVVNVSETVQNIELNVAEIEAQNVEIDFIYPTGPQGPAGSSLWGTISGTLSSQTDLWRYLSAVGTSNFDTQTLVNYLSTTPVTLSSIDVKGQILSAGTNLFDIFATPSGSDSQTLTYVPSSYLLSIIRGNTVNLSSINSTFAANSGKYESIYSTVSNTSANWNTAYSISTAYSASSASFATNTTLCAVSSLLLPTSIYQSASGSFATNTTLCAVSSLLLLTSIYQNASGSFATNSTVSSISSLLLLTSIYQNASGSFATNTTLCAVSSLLLPTSIYQSASSSFATNSTVSSISSLLLLTSIYQNASSSFATNTTLCAVSSLLLPTSIYQNASANWQNTFTNVQSNSANWNTAYTLITATSGYGILTSTVTSDLSVGGISAAQVLSQGTTFQQFVEALLIKVFFPTYTAPSITVTSSIGTTVEAGTIGLTLNMAFLSGSINGLTVGGIWNPSLFQNTRSGIVTAYNAFDTLYSSSASTYPATSSTVVIRDNSNVFSVSANYTQGPQPKDSKNNNYQSPLPPGTVSNTITINGRRRTFYGADTLTVAPTSSNEIRALASSALGHSNGSVFDISVALGSRRVVFAYPSSLRDVTSVIDPNNNIVYTDEFNLTTVSVSGLNSYLPINYKVYSYIPAESFPAPITLRVTI